MAVSLSDLLTVPTEDNLRQQFLSDLNSADFPITDWQSGATLKTYIFLQARAYLIAIGQVIAQIAAGGYLTEAQGEWLTLLALQIFNIVRQEATFTIQRATLTCGAGNGPYTIKVGDLVAQTTAGHRYRNITAGTLATSGTLELQWQGEGPNDSTDPASNYVDQQNTMTILVTPLLGVTVNNPSVDFSPVVLANVTTSLLTATRTDPLVSPMPGVTLIKITTTGQVGAAAFSYRRIGIDSDFVAAGLTAATFDIPTVGIRIGFVNDSVRNPTFLTGQIFSFSAPGGPVITQGRDRETPAALIARCMDRFPDLSEIATDSKYRKWAFAADPQVTKVGVSTDATVPNRVNVTIAGQTNPMTGAAIANVQTFIDARTQGTEFAVVVVAIAKNILISGVVTVPIGTTAAAQVKADAAWTAYVGGIGLGGVVRLASLQQILGDSGATDLASIAISTPNVTAPGGGPVVNVSCASNEAATISISPPGLPSQALTWMEA